MTFAMIVFGLGILLLVAAPRQRRNCDHAFVATASLNFGEHSDRTYACEKCGHQVDGYA